MVKVFISGIDSPFGYNLANVLSQTYVPFKSSDGGGNGAAQDEGRMAEQSSRALQKEKYFITGTLLSEIPFEQHETIHRPAQPGTMIETGDRKKDAARREAIDKIPKIGVKPKSVSALISRTEKEDMLKGILDADVIVFDACCVNLEEITWAVDSKMIVSTEIKLAISEMCDFIEKPKTVILISTIMTWAKTKIDSDDPEATIPEEDYRRRKPHPNFKAHAALEKAIAKHSKKNNFKGYVIAPGLVYHSGDSVFHNMIKAAWNNETLACYGDGTNTVPCIHLEDLITCTVEVIVTAPEAKYILAIDDSKSTLYEIMKTISEHLSNGIVTKNAKEDLSSDKITSQQDIDMLTVNLRLEAGWIKESAIELKYETGLIENIQQIIQEYRDSRGFWALKIMIHGPPASGKSYLAKKLAEQYKLHYLEATEIIKDTISNYERRLNGGKFEGEEVEVEAEKAILSEFKESIKSKGKLSTEQIIGLVRDKMRSMPCKNQGYVLDGYPSLLEEAVELFKAPEDETGEDGKPYACDEQISPEFLFTIVAEDSFIKKRIMSLTETQVTGTKNTEEALTNRLEEFRKINTDELTVLNFFDEAEITPIPLEIQNCSFNAIFSQVCQNIGPSRNYGKSHEQLVEDRRIAEFQKAQAEQVSNREREIREKSEIERLEKLSAEWKIKLETVKSQESETLEAQTEPLRNYLAKYMMPSLTAGLIEVAKIRPEDPVDYLAEFLFKKNVNKQS